MGELEDWLWGEWVGGGMMGALCIAMVLFFFALLDGDYETTLCDDNPVIDLPCDEFGLREAFV